MAKINFINANKICETMPGDTILEVAIRNDVPIQHACGGFCSCTTCHVHVVSGIENLSTMDSDESERIEWVDNKAPLSRLGCQSKINGDVSVQIINLD